MSGIKKNQKSSSEEINFEKSFVRLEEILEKMYSGTASLDEAVKLYEEADKLIVTCNKRLNEAEHKIEVLIKNRAGELAVDEAQNPETKDFTPPTPAE